jgi:hypothetical protein
MRIARHRLLVLSGVLACLGWPGAAWGAPANGKIAFDRIDPVLNGPRNFTIDPDGTHETELPGTASFAPGCHGWSPDSTHLALCVDNPAGLLRPATVAADGSGFTLLDADPRLPLGLGCGLWSPDAGRLLCDNDDGTDSPANGLYTVRAADGGGLVQVTSQPPGRQDLPVGYSPDGRRILFVRNDPNGDLNGDLFTVRPGGGGLLQLNPPDLRVTASGFDDAFDLGGCCGPNAAWSPDGSRVVFSGVWKPATSPKNKGYQAALYIVNADGSGLHAITALGVGSRDGLAWSPDGRLIAFSTRRQIQYPQIDVVRPDGTGQRELTQPTNGDLSVGPVWSPDSTALVFSSYHPEINGGQEDLWIVHADGTGLRRLTSPAPGFAPGEEDPTWGAAPR